MPQCADYLAKELALQIANSLLPVASFHHSWLDIFIKKRKVRERSAIRRSAVSAFLFAFFLFYFMHAAR